MQFQGWNDVALLVNHALQSSKWLPNTIYYNFIDYIYIKYQVVSSHKSEPQSYSPSQLRQRYWTCPPPQSRKFPSVSKYLKCVSKWILVMLCSMWGWVVFTEKNKSPGLKEMASYGQILDWEKNEILHMWMSHSKLHRETKSLLRRLQDRHISADRRIRSIICAALKKWFFTSDFPWSGLGSRMECDSARLCEVWLPFPQTSAFHPSTLPVHSLPLETQI